MAKVYAYYWDLTEEQRRIYRRSDRVVSLPLNALGKLRHNVHRLAHALDDGDRVLVERLSRQLVNAIAVQYSVAVLRVAIRMRRPSDATGDLYGLYEPRVGRSRACITVWMRTAQRNQLVAFNTFLRTLLHELCHHLDYEWLGLDESFHTHGFFKRENSLYLQLRVDE